MQASATTPFARPDSAGIAAGAPRRSHAGVGGPKTGRPSSWFPGSCGAGSTGWGRPWGGGSSSSSDCWPLYCCCSWGSCGSWRWSCSSSSSSWGPTGGCPTSPPVGVLLFLLRLMPRLLLALLLLFLPLLLDAVKPGGPGRPPRDERSLGLLVHRTGIPRSPIAARPITYGDRVPLDPGSGGSGAPSCPWE